jgi:hypothetical protein
MKMPQGAPNEPDPEVEVTSAEVDAANASRVTSIYYCKPTKAKVLGLLANDVAWHNPAWQPRDFSRYGRATGALLDAAAPDPQFVAQPSSPDSTFLGLPQVQAFEALPKCNTGVAFIHDTVHFLTPREVVGLFERSPKLVSLYATMVLPPEAMERLPSLYPELYVINYHDDGFDYLPGGDAGGAYCHSYAHLDWLTIGAIRGYHFELTVERISSCAAHHVFQFVRRTVGAPARRAFAYDSCVLLPSAFADHDDAADLPLPRKLANQLFLYTESVGKIDHQTMFAKIRQLLPGAALVTMRPDHILHIVNFFVAVRCMSAQDDHTMILAGGWWTRIKARVDVWSRNLFRPVGGGSKWDAMKEALKWKTFSLTVTCRTADARTAWEKAHQVASIRQAIPAAFPQPKLPSTSAYLMPYIQTPAPVGPPEEDLVPESAPPSPALGSTAESTPLQTPASQELIGLDPESLFQVIRPTVRRPKTRQPVHEIARDDLPELRMTFGEAPWIQEGGYSGNFPETVFGCHNEYMDLQKACNTRLPASPARYTFGDCTPPAPVSPGPSAQSPEGPPSLVAAQPEVSLTPPGGRLFPPTPLFGDHYTSGVVDGRTPADDPTAWTLDAEQLAQALTRVINARGVLVAFDPPHSNSPSSSVRSLDTAALFECFVAPPALSPGSPVNDPAPSIGTAEINSLFGISTTPTTEASPRLPKKNDCGLKAFSEVLKVSKPRVWELINEKFDQTGLEDAGQTYEHLDWVAKKLGVRVPIIGDADAVIGPVDFAGEWLGPIAETIYCSPGHWFNSVDNPEGPQVAYQAWLRKAAAQARAEKKKARLPAPSLTFTDDEVLDKAIAENRVAIQEEQARVADLVADLTADCEWGYSPLEVAALNSCGFTNLAPQYKGSARIPANRIHAIQPNYVEAPRTTIHDDPSCPEPIARLSMRLAAIGRHFYTPKHPMMRAQALESDIKNTRLGGSWSNEETRTKIVAMLSMVGKDDARNPVCVIQGAGGGAKTQFLIDWLLDEKANDVPVDVVIICPTRELRDKWCGDLPTFDPRRIKTYEKALEQLVDHDLLIFDDYSKFPPGFIEACLRRHNGPIVLTGDTRQSKYHCPNENATIAGLAPAMEFYQRCSDYYLNSTHRNEQSIANALGVHSSRVGHSSVTMSSVPPSDGRPFLFSTTAQRDAARESGRRAFTYAGCQGLTCKATAIVLTRESAAVQDDGWYTALSRAESDIVIMPEYSTEGYACDSFDADKLSSTPFLQAFINVYQDIKANELPEPKVPEPVVPEPELRTRLVCEPVEPLYDAVIEVAGEKFDREMYVNGEHTNVFQTEDVFVQQFAHQQAKDEPLLAATVKKRIIKGAPEDNKVQFRAAREIGSTLFENYRKAMGLPKEPLPFQNALWGQCEKEVTATFAAKSAGQLHNSITRQDPDYDPFFITLFNKSQWVKKEEKFGKPAKPGQTIASFKQQVVMEFGIMSKYVRRIRERFCPDNIYVNCGTTPDHLSDWVAKGWNTTRPAFSNDYVAYDQSQDASMLAFEYYLYDHCGVPGQIIERYLAIKTQARAFPGFLAIMRFSGEGPTFDANTMCNIAYHFTRFEVTDDTKLAFAGDDMVQDRTPQEKDSFAAISRDLKLEGKPVHHTQTPGDCAPFCGWLFTKYGIVGAPKKACASLDLSSKVKLEEGFLTSAAHLAGHAYGMGDRLMEVYSEEEQAYHSRLVNRLIKAKVPPQNTPEAEKSKARSWLAGLFH